MLPASRVVVLKRSLALLCLCAFVMGLWSMPASATRTKKTIEFNRDIRPIITKCFTCHGHDPNALMAGLRLDRRDTAIAPLKDGHTAIVPGHPERSELVKRIYDKGVDQMPPPSSNKFLNDEERQLLKDWIAEGAEYKEHWGFVTPVRPQVPDVRDKSWPKNPIDNFVLEKLEEKGLHPSPEADRATLIRRVSLDLIGLPPTPEEVQAFVADKSPNAYEKVVDRLLASPRYGERMAMDWMDYARYADSNGYQADYERYQWAWRDWVINAYNKNMPFDEFTVEQLAGDLIPGAKRDQVIATGFNRNHRINTEGGVIPEEWRIETVIDRVETTAQTWLALTAGCARCHDHKYDPISQKEFYSLTSYFNNVPESGTGVERPVNHPPILRVPNKFQEERQVQFDKELSRFNSELDRKRELAAPQSTAWSLSDLPKVKSLDDGLVVRYRLTSPPLVAAGAGPTPSVKGSVDFEPGRSSGSARTNDNGFVDLGKPEFDPDKGFSVSIWMNPQRGSGSPIAQMEMGPYYHGWDMYLSGNSIAVHLINRWESDALKVVSKGMVPLDTWTHVAFTYDGSKRPEGVKIYVNGQLTENYVPTNALKGSIKPDVTLKLGRRNGSDSFLGKVDEPAIYGRVLAESEVKGLASVHPAQPFLSIPPDKRTQWQKKQLAHLWALDHDKSYKRLDEERSEITEAKRKLEMNIPSVMVMSEMEQPRQAHVLIRGQYDHKGDKVDALVPAALPPLPKGVPNNRLGLAKWIVSPSNPLTSRVTVNRMWERLFGTGIVATSEDFGTRAEFPSHPELLDWLGTEFIRLKWDQKAMWKELVMSATYRQSSSVSEKLLKIDAPNRLLARGPRFRLPGEVIRDQALAAAGLLVQKIGGPSVRPYQPEGVWDETGEYGNLRNYKHDVGQNLYRRSLYTIWKRTASPANMTMFDVPTRESCRVTRARTDTPLQALDLLNDVTYLEASRALAHQMLESGAAEDSGRLSYGFARVLGRSPSPQELQILKQSLQKRIALYRSDPKRAEQLLSMGDMKNNPKLDKAQLAAYTLTASTLLNLDETVTKE